MPQPEHTVESLLSLMDQHVRACVMVATRERPAGFDTASRLAVKQALEQALGQPRAQDQEPLEAMLAGFGSKVRQVGHEYLQSVSGELARLQEAGAQALREGVQKLSVLDMGNGRRLVLVPAGQIKERLADLARQHMRECTAPPAQPAASSEPDGSFIDKLVASLNAEKAQVPVGRVLSHGDIEELRNEATTALLSDPVFTTLDARGFQLQVLLRLARKIEERVLERVGEKSAPQLSTTCVSSLIGDVEARLRKELAGAIGGEDALCIELPKQLAREVERLVLLRENRRQDADAGALDGKSAVEEHGPWAAGCGPRPGNYFIQSLDSKARLYVAGPFSTADAISTYAEEIARRLNASVLAGVPGLDSKRLLDDAEQVEMYANFSPALLFPVGKRLRVLAAALEALEARAESTGKRKPTQAARSEAPVPGEAHPLSDLVSRGRKLGLSVQVLHRPKATEIDPVALGKQIVPEGVGDEAWLGMARQFVTDVLRKLGERHQLSQERLHYYVTTAAASELLALLERAELPSNFGVIRKIAADFLARWATNHGNLA